jgi:hypothetical protein
MKDNGKDGRAGNGLKVGLNAGLHRLIVIRHDRKHRVGARRFGTPRQLNGLMGRIRPRSSDDPNTATRGFDGGADDAVVLDRRQGYGFAGGLGDHDHRHARFNLTFAQPDKGRQIEVAILVERGGEIGDIAPEPSGGIYNCGHRISRRAFHFAIALSIRGEHKALLASDAGLDPETHLLQPGSNLQAEAAFV